MKLKNSFKRYAIFTHVFSPSLLQNLSLFIDIDSGLHLRRLDWFYSWQQWNWFDLLCKQEELNRSASSIVVANSRRSNNNSNHSTRITRDLIIALNRTSKKNESVSEWVSIKAAQNNSTPNSIISPGCFSKMTSLRFARFAALCLLLSTYLVTAQWYSPGKYTKLFNLALLSRSFLRWLSRFRL